MDAPLRVTIQGREYALRVRAGTEAETGAFAAALDARIAAFRQAFPSQPELTAIVMTALALAEELHELRRAAGAAQSDTARAFDHLDALLADALADGYEDEPDDAETPVGEAGGAVPALSDVPDHAASAILPTAEGGTAA